MKRLLVVGLFLFFWCRLAAAEDGKFSSALTPDDYAAAGLNTLTPAQRARLDELVENYKSGALAEARRAADEAAAAKRTAEADAARAAAEAQAAVAAAKLEVEKANQAKAAAEQQAAKAEVARRTAAKSSHAGLFSQAKDFFKKDQPLAESTVVGKFQGWSPHQIFTLANGQRWQVANAVSYYVRPAENVKAQILPAATFGYWMRFPDYDTQVRVNFISDN